MRSLEAAMRGVRRAGAEAVRFGLALLVAVAPVGAGGRSTEIITSQSPTGAADRQALLGFDFHCNTGYSVRDCDAQLTRLRDVLAGLELTPLGDWTWILVRSDDWKPILRRVGRDPDSPAFTILEKRQTFLEESLFSPTPDRSRPLLEKWRIPLGQLLALAVSHELGHALCHERNEVRANEYAAQLRSTGRATCN